MALASGARLGPYEIIAPLGSGGMGDVYRAHDPRTGRDVAIKIAAEHVLFEGRYRPFGYDVSPDGKRFLELRRKVPLAK